jgi:hypothetical protein
MQKWIAELDKHNGPHLRLYINGKRTTVLIPAADAQPSKNISQDTIDQVRELLWIDDEKPF